MKNKRVVIAGAGLSSLVLAVLLSDRGYEVRIFEQNSHYGGKLKSINESGFRFDLGPSIITMKEVYEEVFNILNLDIKNFLQFKKLETLTTFHEDQTKFRLKSGSIQEISEQLSIFLQEPVDSLLNYFNFLKKIDIKVKKLFLERDVSKKHLLTDRKLWKELIKFWQFKPFDSLDSLHTRYFTNQKTIDFFNRYATYAGLNPLKAPAVYSIIAYQELIHGSYYLENGIHEIAKVFKKLAIDKGVYFEFGSELKSISYSNREIESFLIDNKRVEADIFVSGIDYYFFQQLLNRPNLNFEHSKLSTSALVFYWGVDKEYSLDYHNVFSSKDITRELSSISKGSFFDDPTVYINNSSALISTDSPDGMQNLFVMINAPSRLISNTEIHHQRKLIIEKLNRVLGFSEKSIIFEKVLSPNTLKKRDGNYMGSLYGLAPESILGLIKRPTNVDKLNNLFYIGGAVHPGGGMPMVTQSALIVNEIIRKTYE